MKTKLSFELVLIAIILAPLIYIAAKWNAFPDTIPIHWNVKGEVDDYGSKYHLLFFTGMNLGLYFLMIILPKIDPRKRNYDAFSGLYLKIRFVITLFMTVIGMLIALEAAGMNVHTERVIVVAVTLLFTLLGNYIVNVKPNFFIGVRTPWTLDNNEVWRKTHALAGRLWFWTGLTALLVSFFLPDNMLPVLMMVVIPMIAAIPVVYSFIIFKKLQKESH